MSKPAKPPRRRTWETFVPIILLVAAVLFLVFVERIGRLKSASDVGPWWKPWRSAPEGMVWIPGGPFVMGDAKSSDGDAPLHSVSVKGLLAVVLLILLVVGVGVLGIQRFAGTGKKTDEASSDRKSVV